MIYINVETFLGKKYLLLMALTLVLASLTLAACGGGDGAGADSADAGEQLFKKSTVGTTAGCKTCHSLEPGAVIVGPSLAGIASRAGNLVSGVSAEDYLRQSILEPDAYLVKGYPASVMPKVWGEQLSEEQVNGLVEYLLTLK